MITNLQRSNSIVILYYCSTISPYHRSYSEIKLELSPRAHTLHYNIMINIIFNIAIYRTRSNYLNSQKLLISPFSVK